MGPDRGGGGSKIAMFFFLQKTDEYSELCEQERYRDGTSMRGVPKIESKSDAHCVLRYSRHCSFRIPTPRPNSEPNRL